MACASLFCPYLFHVYQGIAVDETSVAFLSTGSCARG